VGCARLVLIASLHEINLPPIRPFNKLSNGVSHMQIDQVVAEIHRFEHSKIVLCTEMVIKSVNMHRFRILFHDCLLKIRRKTLRLEVVDCSRVLSFESVKSDSGVFISVFDTHMRGKV